MEAPRLVPKKPKLERSVPNIQHHQHSDVSDYSALLREGEEEFRRRLGIASTITCGKAAVN